MILMGIATGMLFLYGSKHVNRNLLIVYARLDRFYQSFMDDAANANAHNELVSGNLWYVVG